MAEALLALLNTFTSLAGVSITTEGVKVNWARLVTMTLCFPLIAAMGTIIYGFIAQIVRMYPALFGDGNFSVFSPFASVITLVDGSVFDGAPPVVTYGWQVVRFLIYVTGIDWLLYWIVANWLFGFYPWLCVRFIRLGSFLFGWVSKLLSGAGGAS